MGARSASFQKIPMPQLKYQQKPDHACPIAIASEMLIQQCTDRLWFEDPPCQGGGPVRVHSKASFKLLPIQGNNRSQNPCLPRYRTFRGTPIRSPKFFQM